MSTAGTLPAARAIEIACATKRAESETAGRRFSVLRALLLGALLAAPLTFGGVEAWAWGTLCLLVSILVVVWVIDSLRRGVLKLAWSPLYVPGVLVLLLGVVQLASGRTLDPAGSREALVKLSIDFMIFYLVPQFFDAAPQETWTRAGLVVVVFTFALALFAVFQFYSDPTRVFWSVKPRWGGSIFGPYVNHNHYAGLMEMLIPLSAASAAARPGGSAKRALLALAVVLPVASVLLSGSRGGLVSLLVESLVACWVYGGATAPRRHFKTAGAALIGVAAASMLFFWMDTGRVYEHLGTVFEVRRLPEVGFTARKMATVDSLRIFRDHLWSGTGLGSFEAAYPAYQSAPSDEVWDHAHNDYAEALAETGLAGGLLIATALVLFLRLAFSGLRQGMTSPGGALRFGATLGCCGLLVHSALDFNLHIPANAAWFAVCAAWATSPPIRGSEGGQEIS